VLHTQYDQAAVTSRCLACTVRGCARPLVRTQQTLVCTSGHAFDVARVGYVNLLQPQDRRSLEAGDVREAVEARSDLLSRGIGRHIVQQVATAVVSRLRSPGASVLDLGSGTGELLADIAAQTTIDGIGIDLSVAAITHAARTHPSLSWIVANADRRLPIQDGCIAAVVSMHGRRNPVECARVLEPSGILVVVVPGVQDLRELRTAIGGGEVEQNRVAGVLADHDHEFRLVQSTTLEEHHRLERPTLVQLLRATYRGSRRSAAHHVERLDTLDVTLASDLLIFERLGGVRS
jgi:23S rRNA (guanine745-N1)-methyltransferase